jgi:hypothetical protein
MTSLSEEGVKVLNNLFSTIFTDSELIAIGSYINDTSSKQILQMLSLVIGEPPFPLRISNVIAGQSEAHYQLSLFSGERLIPFWIEITNLMIITITKLPSRIKVSFTLACSDDVEQVTEFWVRPTPEKYHTIVRLLKNTDAQIQNKQLWISCLRLELNPTPMGVPASSNIPAF